MKKAHELPLNTKVIQIHTGDDGCWITLTSSKGKSVSFQPASQFKFSGIGSAALHEWLDDRQKEFEAGQTESHVCKP